YLISKAYYVSCFLSIAQSHGYDKIFTPCKTCGLSLTTSKCKRNPPGVRKNNPNPSAAVLRNRSFCLHCENGFYMSTSSHIADPWPQLVSFVVATGLMDLVAITYYSQRFRSRTSLQKRTSRSSSIT